MPDWSSVLCSLMYAELGISSLLSIQNRLQTNVIFYVIWNRLGDPQKSSWSLEKLRKAIPLLLSCLTAHLYCVPSHMFILITSNHLDKQEHWSNSEILYTLNWTSVQICSHYQAFSALRQIWLFFPQKIWSDPKSDFKEGPRWDTSNRFKWWWRRKQRVRMEFSGLSPSWQVDVRISVAVIIHRQRMEEKQWWLYPVEGIYSNRNQSVHAGTWKGQCVLGVVNLKQQII